MELGKEMRVYGTMMVCCGFVEKGVIASLSEGDARDQEPTFIVIESETGETLYGTKASQFASG